MRRTSSWLLVCALIPAVFAGPGAPVVVWTTTVATGSAEHRPAHGNDDHWTRLRQGDLVPPLSTVRTGRRGRVVLDATGSRIILGPRAELELPAPSDAADAREILHSSGMVSYEVREGGRSLDVVTPLAVIAMGEAEIAVELEDVRATVLVRAGSARVTSRLDGSSARLGPGDVASVDVERGGAPEVHHRIAVINPR